MNKYLTLFVLLCCSLPSFGSRDLIRRENIGNIHFECLFDSRNSRLEIHDIFNLFKGLVIELVEEKKYDGELYISFMFDNVLGDNTDDNYTWVGFGEYVWKKDINFKKSNFVQGSGLKIIFKSQALDIEKYLTIIANSISNLENVRKNQQLIDVKYMDTITVTSVSRPMIVQFKTEKDKIAEKILKTRLFSGHKKSTNNYLPNYFFQNNKFHFYKEDSVLLILDNIFEIIGSIDDGYLIFRNDSTFYFMSEEKDTISEPVIVNGLSEGRVPIIEYERIKGPIDRFVLKFYTLKRLFRSVYFPVSNTIVPDFDRLENDMFMEIIHGQKSEESQAKSILVILSILVLSIVVNIFLLFKR